MSHLSRAMRLMDMIERLKERQRRGQGYTSQELAELYNVSQRTIQNDIQELRQYPEYATLIRRIRMEWVYIDMMKTCGCDA